MPDPKRLSAFNIFSVSQDVSFNRIGKKVFVKGIDGTNQESDSVEANLLFEILKVLKAKK